MAAHFNRDMRALLDAPEAQPPTVAHRIQNSPVAAFAPWVIYWVVASSPSTWFYGAVAAVLTAIILPVPGWRRGRIRLFDSVTIVFFAVLAVAGIVGGAQDREWMDTHSTLISSAVLAVVVLGSLAFTPFTERYVDESTPPQVRNSREFRRANQRLTVMWGLVFAAIAVLGYVAVSVPASFNWTSWMIPIVLLVFAVRISQLSRQRVTQRGQYG